MEQGVNLFGRCTQPNCRKKFAVKLGLGRFEVGKKRQQLDNSYQAELNLTHVSMSEQASVIHEEFEAEGGFEQDLIEHNMK